MYWCRNGEIQTILPRFGKDGGKRVGGEVVKLDNQQEEIPPLLLRLSRARHGGETGHAPALRPSDDKRQALRRKSVGGARQARE